MHSGYNTTRFAQCQRLVQRLRRNGTWFVPTLGLAPAYRGIAGDSVFEYFRARVQEFEAGALPSGNWLRHSTHAPPASPSPEPLPTQ